jgi:hypothetical protein
MSVSSRYVIAYLLVQHKQSPKSRERSDGDCGKLVERNVATWHERLEEDDTVTQDVRTAHQASLRQRTCLWATSSSCFCKVTWVEYQAQKSVVSFDNDQEHNSLFSASSPKNAPLAMEVMRHEYSCLHGIQGSNETCANERSSNVQRWQSVKSCECLAWNGRDPVRV